jgi:hypothetical protein
MLAMRASGMQLMIAFGTEVESALHSRITLRTAALQRLPQDEIQNDSKAVSNHNRNHRPQHSVHTPPAGIAIDVADQQQIASEYSSDQNTKKSPKSRRGSVSLMRHEGRKENLRSHKASGRQHPCPLGNKTDLLRKLSSYFAPHLHYVSPLFLSLRRAIRVGEVNAASQEKQAGDHRWRKPKNHETHLPNWS